MGEPGKKLKKANFGIFRKQIIIEQRIQKPLTSKFSFGTSGILKSKPKCNIFLLIKTALQKYLLCE